MPRKKKLPKYVTVRDGIWYVRKSVPGIKYPVWRVCHDQTQEGVDAVLDDIETDVGESVDEPEIKTVGDRFDEWLASIKGDISPRTYSDYSEILKRYFRKPIGLRLPGELQPKDLEKIFQSMKAKGLAPRTRRYAQTVIGASLKSPAFRSIVAPGLLDTVNNPRLRKKEFEVFNHEEAKQFFAACYGEEFGPCFQFALETGMRPEEHLALKWTDVDLKRRTAQIRRVLVFHRGGGGWSFESPKTPQARRTVKFSEQITKILKNHRRDLDIRLARLMNKDNSAAEWTDPKTVRDARQIREARLRLESLERQKEFNLVFPTDDFRPMRIDNLGRRHMKPILKKAGLSQSMTPKGLRHTCATLLLIGGINPKVVSERLGHASIVITLEIYSHVLPILQDEATAKLAKMLH